MRNGKERKNNLATEYTANTDEKRAVIPMKMGIQC